MIVNSDAQSDKTVSETDGISAPAQQPAKRNKPEAVTPMSFIQGVSVGDAGGVQGVVTNGVGRTPTDHAWPKHGDDQIEFLVNKPQGRKPAYFTMASFEPSKVSRFHGRDTPNSRKLRGIPVDIEGSAKKFTKPGGPDKGYPNGKAVVFAANAFIKASGMVPNYMVDTTSGGWHMYYVFDVALERDEWKPRAAALVALMDAHKLKIDAPCTTNAAQIMRAPGSLHQDTGRVVTPYRLRSRPYTVDEFDKLVGFAPGVVETDLLPRPAAAKAHATNNLIGNHQHSPFSYKQAAMQCAAMRQAAMHNGRDTGYDAWYISAKTADLSIEGREYAHEISSGHPDYDEAATDKKIDSLDGGPAGCDKWASVYGAGGPCDTCALRGRAASNLKCNTS